MWKVILQLFKKESFCDEAFHEAIEMLRASQDMFNDSMASLKSEGCLEIDIYERDRLINKYERDVRRKIITHLAVSTDPDTNSALVLTAIIIDIERIGDFTKNIVELAADCQRAFRAGEIEDDVSSVERMVASMFDEIIPALENTDVQKARKIYSDHEVVSEIIERNLHLLSRGDILADDSGSAVIAALYLRYLKRISAHLKNVATSIVNPYYRIGFREKPEQVRC